MNLKGGWRIKPKLYGDPVYAEYINRMADEQRKRFPPKPRPVKPEGMSEEDFQFSLQSPETQKIILAQKDPNYVRDWEAPLPENAQIKDKDGNVDVAARAITGAEESTYRNMQRAEKNTIGQITDEEIEAPHGSNRDRGIQAFFDAGPALLSVSEIQGIRSGEIDTDPYGPPKQKWVTIPAWKAFWFMITGRGKNVRSEKE